MSTNKFWRMEKPWSLRGMRCEPLNDKVRVWQMNVSILITLELVTYGWDVNRLSRPASNATSCDQMKVYCLDIHHVSPYDMTHLTPKWAEQLLILSFRASYLVISRSLCLKLRLFLLQQKTYNFWTFCSISYYSLHVATQP